MATSALSGVLSPQQIAVLQQARAALARSVSVPGAPAGTAPSAAKSDPPLSVAPRSRGQIVNIVV
ncbi:MAG TPA: hypothetical protein VJR47_05965 [Stellaceae bacterium]|nr:hypothetical protein [Stellaceae bacterium]